MKLYATTTSERASKGQGGEWLDIIVKNKDNQTALVVKVRTNKGSIGRVYTTIIRDIRYSAPIELDKPQFIEETKGEKKKGKRPFEGWNDNIQAQSRE
jgi:hypothetical protein